MEDSLKERNRVGVDDFILLEDYTNIDAFVNNLKKRYEKNIIYTNIRNILVSVNPYKTLPIYGPEVLNHYSKAKINWLTPHIFGLAESAYRFLRREKRAQLILITGEAGAGKTDTSKKIIKFIAEVSGDHGTMEKVKNRLIYSNPLLEAFGNAKTMKNDNSSRFGKYMEIEFNSTGQAVGGKILNYLLETSRITQQNPGDRNFKIFYQLLGCDDIDLLNNLSLGVTLNSYNILKNSKDVYPNESKSENEQFYEVITALKTMGISKFERNEIFGIVASILHLGNVTFKENDGKSQIENTQPIYILSEILGCSVHQICYALTNRTLETSEDLITIPHNVEMSNYAKKSFSEVIYSRLFSWLVSRINESLAEHPKNVETTSYGILDIYGFEIFEKNSFEQFCINYCNEKLQQLYVELTLKIEQQEYIDEGIEWVFTDYTSNNIICDLIEKMHEGIIFMLNEECLRPGNTSDFTFHEKMNENLANHCHYVTHSTSDTETQKTMGRDEFRIKHYAGDVTYNVNGFLEKNKGFLSRDLRELMHNSTNSIVKNIFSKEEVKSRKRPNTVLIDFRTNVNKLMDLLKTKDASYIKCIKPNDYQEPNVFDDELVKHQVKYLGLMECVKIGRAGFAFRRLHEDFLSIYKILSRKTWIKFNGTAKEGISIIMNTIKLKPNEFFIGKTKIFIRSPESVSQIENAYEAKKHDIAAIIQSAWRGRLERKKYLQIKNSTCVIQSFIRGFIARRRVKRIRNAVQIIRRFIEGVIKRHEPENDFNRHIVQLVRASWLIQLSKNLPKTVLDKSWPSCPKVCEEASALLREMRMKQLALRYRSGITPEMKKKFQEKVLAEFLFKGRKRLYESSIPDWFHKDRLTPQQREKLPNFQNGHLKHEKLLYSTSATKFDRHGYKKRNRALFFTNKHIYLVDGKNYKLKHKILYKNIVELTVTTEGDNFIILRIDQELKNDKGDLILSLPNLIETVTVFVDITQKSKLLKVTNESIIKHYIINENPRTIKVVAGSTGSIPDICKNKSGELVIMG